jgi:hypothetical protein
MIKACRCGCGVKWQVHSRNRARLYTPECSRERRRKSNSARNWKRKYRNGFG